VASAPAKWLLKILKLRNKPIFKTTRVSLQLIMNKNVISDFERCFCRHFRKNKPIKPIFNLRYSIYDLRFADRQQKRIYGVRSAQCGTGGNNPSESDSIRLNPTESDQKKGGHHRQNEQNEPNLKRNPSSLRFDATRAETRHRLQE